MVGFCVQLPYVYKETSREVIRGLLFISNFWFARDHGYFADAVVDKSLLHTWSLSVEWQFYLIYPLLLLAWAKFCSLRTLPHFIGALFGLSLVASFLLTSDKSYFMLHTRAWELLLGGIIFTLPPLRFGPRLSRVLELAALLVIILNMALAEPMQGWQAWQVVPGVFACALILWLKIEHSVLAPAVLQYLGKISYSMYLIHWPVITLCSKLGWMHYFLPILGFIIVYSVLSYHFIETKRRWSRLVLLSYVLVIGGAQAGEHFDGATPFNDNYLEGKHYRDVYYGGRDIPEFGAIYHGTTADVPEFMLIGDSYCRQYANFLNAQHIPFVGVFSNGQLQFKDIYVYPLFKHQSTAEYQLYYDNYRALLAQTAADTVVIGHNWRNYLFNQNLGTEYAPSILDQEARRQAIAQGIIELAESYPGKEFYVLGLPVVDPHSGEECVVLRNSQHALHKLLFSGLDCPRSVAVDFTIPNEVNAYLRAICAQRSNLHFVDLNPAICHDGVCRVLTEKDQLIFSDGSHLSLFGAEIVGEYLLQQIKADSK